MESPTTVPTLQIRRKPIAPQSQSQQTPSSAAGPGLGPDPTSGRRQCDEKPPPLPERPGREKIGTRQPQIQTAVRPVSRGAEPSPLLAVPDHVLRPRTSLPELSHSAPDSTPQSPFNAVPASAAATFGPSASSSDGGKNFMQTVLSEARYFAGGLIPHPIESTKHYTILRHSPALIFYRGPATSLAITIFSSPDRPLPADRTLWLQQRGFSGDSGMKIKSFFNLTDDWLHVTPSTQVTADQVPADTERAWQRDIAKATKKLLKEKGQKKAHIPRETHVVRIPEASEDGYFRLILCTGRDPPYAAEESSSRSKTLCTSPIFRIASTSSDSSIFRGASLSTLPLELGVYAASMVASSTVDPYIAPVRDPVQAAIDTVRPGFVAETVGGLVSDELTERSVERDEAFFTAHQAHVERALAADPEAIQPIGPDSGPEDPFPIKFQGKVVKGTGRSQAELGIPTANLSGVADEVRYRLNGIYFGWARVLPKSRSKSTPVSSAQQTVSPPDSSPSSEWHEAIITIAPSSPYARPSAAPTPFVAVHLLTTPPSPSPSPSPSSPSPATPTTPTFLGATLQALILGLLRPHPPPTANTQIQARLDAATRDACLTLASLARENWRPERAAEALRLRGRERSFGERVDDVMGWVERKAGTMHGKLPVHLIGVRRAGAEERDRSRGVGGFWVKRDVGG
ncbi:c4940f14-3ce8-48cc-a2e0-d41928235843 [Thermothielavioides terrestris]|uniref:Riboflavin kinase n=1 Tax=Thermothielavioides terrestris TaxID=2587410 RepID=A0A446BJJ3_9PEZI|nr:c4940f14-3ce8-48cc-a2e0-d41928235843 [Thermothielavioides terrestris]